jgi:NADH-quinone oxidoreductase subunit N
LLSLAGIPPLAGFFGKFYIFISALDIADHSALLWLVLLALGMSVISFYYYLKVLKQAYVAEPMAGAAVVSVPLTTRIALWAIAALVVVLGCLPDFLMNRIAAALPSAFH